MKFSTVLVIVLLAFLIAVLVSFPAKAEWWSKPNQLSNQYFFPLASSVPPPAQWNKTYGGTSDDRGFSLVQTGDGGYALAGYTWSYGAGAADFWLVKTDSGGNQQWTRTYGGMSSDFANSVVQTSDEGYAIAGYTGSYGAGNGDFWLVKTDSSGNLQWNRTYGGTGNDYPNCVVQTLDEGYALAGQTNSYPATGAHFWLVKTDSSGNMQWNRTYGETGGESAVSVVQTGDGGYALAGLTTSYGAPDFWLVKTDSVGNMQWNKTYGGPTQDLANSLVQTSDGGYAIAGWTDASGGDFWLVKTDSAGTALWNKTYGGAKYEMAYSVVQTSDEGYAIAGYTESYGAGMTDYWLVKTDSVGNMQWNKTYGGTSYDDAHSLVQTSDGGYAIAGYTYSYGTGLGYPDFWLVKTESAPVDSTPPTTSNNYDGQYHTQDFTIRLTATDDSSGVAETYYKINNGPTKTVSVDGQPRITTEGENTLEYWSRDNAGNEEAHHILRDIKLDKTPPSITVGPGYLEEALLGVAIGAVAVVGLVVYKMRKRPKKPPTPTPKMLRIQAEPREILADGKSTSTITLQLLDEKGTPIAASEDIQVSFTSTRGRIEKPTITIAKGKEEEKTVLMSSVEIGPVTVSANAKGLKSITMTLNFVEKKRYCMHCGTIMPFTARLCQKCGNAPPAGVDTKVCLNCNSVIPVVAKFCSECGAGQPK